MCDDPRCSVPSSNDPAAVRRYARQYSAWLRHRILEHGWAVLSILSEGRRRHPGFSYTIGLWSIGHPELVVFGLAPDRAQTLLNEVSERVRTGLTLVGRETVSAVSMHPSHYLRVFPLPDAESVLLRARDQFRGDHAEPVSALQLVWADENGAFPWEPSYDSPAWLQPMPGTFAA
jgi:uncharacterized protein DUF4262